MRHHLGFTKAEVPEARLRSLWRSLDRDNSGYIDAGEFGRFMKKVPSADGSEGMNAAKARALMLVRKNETQQALRADLDARAGRDVTVRLANVPTATEEQVVELANHLTRRMASLYAGQERAWYKIYKFMDEDNSGRVEFYEFSKMVSTPSTLPSTPLPYHISGRVEFYEFSKMVCLLSTPYTLPSCACRLAYPPPSLYQRHLSPHPTLRCAPRSHQASPSRPRSCQRRGSTAYGRLSTRIRRDTSAPASSVVS